jgi:hypothetical protein
MNVYEQLKKSQISEVKLESMSRCASLQGDAVLER